MITALNHIYQRALVHRAMLSPSTFRNCSLSGTNCTCSNRSTIHLRTWASLFSCHKWCRTVTLWRAWAALTLVKASALATSECHTSKSHRSTTSLWAAGKAGCLKVKSQTPEFGRKHSLSKSKSRVTWTTINLCSQASRNSNKAHIKKLKIKLCEPKLTRWLSRNQASTKVSPTLNGRAFMPPMSTT
jgi:hypothetical protein